MERSLHGSELDRVPMESSAHQGTSRPRSPGAPGLREESEVVGRPGLGLLSPRLLPSPPQASVPSSVNLRHL